ncbi:hypothetical protein AMECASPLE_003889 [Ameca splendens]|uniref:Uncharacterized protein n=1 Tax=Ameca splendens TaxID=208324 RepID=A0ABV0YWS3_9TELE
MEVYVNTVPRHKQLSDVGEATVAANHSQKGFNRFVHTVQFYIKIKKNNKKKPQNLKVGKTISWQASQESLFQQVHYKMRLHNASCKSKANKIELNLKLCRPW